MSEAQTVFPPHLSGEGDPRSGGRAAASAAEWWSEAPPFPGASRRPFDPMLRIGPLPHLRGEESLSLGEPGQDKYRTMKRARRLRTSMTDAEMILWSRLRRRQIEGFKIRRQHPIGPYIADFACADAKLVIEVDGETHGSPDERARDFRRTRFMESQGWQVIRCYNVEVYDNLDGVLIQIAEALTARAFPPRVSGEGDRAEGVVEGRRADARRNAGSKSLSRPAAATPSTLLRQGYGGPLPPLRGGRESRSR